MAEVSMFEICRMDGSAELAEVTARLLAELPTWFGIPEANAAYVEASGRLPGLVARVGAEPVGVLVLQQHFPESAEIHLMAVARSWHRRGVGRALVGAVESALERDGCRLLQVKTLGASHPDRGYAGTRAFYRSVGFLPLEERNDLWPGNPCLIMVKGLGRSDGGG
ncbi:GNAT family N-acetyltransferase [Streptomyces sp. MST-110588]|uniref:GNAT family N-acetyltransferase n=1 Tax=Streptomyces sp. MST-110588 TaxID=2833628 RepID=UPI001F5C1507|nr:GNAT family N-acetyltransferase [Streptomyces sp. MST-110588]UNO40743.1 GNAT family N-acetyltransferase [Streptomyces sp. MST-110588]